MRGDYNGEWGFTPEELAPPIPYAGRRSSSTPSTITYDPKIVCGYCGYTANAHPRFFFNERSAKWELVCGRQPEEVGDVYAERYETQEALAPASGPRTINQELLSETSMGHNSDWDWTYETGLPIAQSGSGTPVDKRSDRWALEPEVSDGADRKYDDLNSSEFTQAGNVTTRKVYVDPVVQARAKRINDQKRAERAKLIALKKRGPVKVASDKALVAKPVEHRTDHRAWIHDQEFLVVEYYDEELTERTAKRVLNVYNDKRTGRLRVGSIDIVPCEGGIIDARCVNSKAGCDGSLITEGEYAGMRRGRMSINPELATREQMQDFVLDVIRHGNNHAADFIKYMGSWSNGRWTPTLVEDEDGNMVRVPRNDYYEIGRALPRKDPFAELLAHYAKEWQAA